MSPIPSPTRRRRRAALSLLLIPLALLLAPVGAASGSTGQITIFDDTGLLGVDAQRLNARLNELDRLGVDAVRVVLHWRSFAPAPANAHRPDGFNPANPGDYPQSSFVGLDATVRGVSRRGMRMLLTPAGPFPDWASESGSSKLSDPKPVEYRRFVAALGRRYGGSFRPGAGSSCGLELVCPSAAAAPLPRVDFWSAWNEPNQKIFLRPQIRDGRPYSPRLYRRLVIAAQRGLASSGHGGDDLLIGDTAPSGGRDGVDPIDFLRGVLCLDGDFRRNPRCDPIDAAGWAHHPYGLGDAPYRHTTNPGLINLATIGRMVRALGLAKRANATTTRLPIYATEYGIQTRPAERGVSLRKQVEYLAISEFLTWRNPAIRSYAQYLLHDDPPEYEFSFTTGLRFHSGKAKPSFRAFPLTMLARREGRRVRIWGHVRPATGPVRVEVSYGANGRTRLLRAVRTSAGGYFGFNTRYRPGRRWIAKCVLPGGRRLSGPYVHAISF